MAKPFVYELVLMIRPDVSTKHIYDITQAVKDLLTQSGGTIHTEEYWGFRTLAYRVEKRAKAHYTYVVFSGGDLDALQHHLKFHTDVFRFMNLRTDARQLDLTQRSPLFHSTLEELQHAQDINVRGENQ